MADGDGMYTHSLVFPFDDENAGSVESAGSEFGALWAELTSSVVSPDRDVQTHSVAPSQYRDSTADALPVIGE